MCEKRPPCWSRGDLDSSVQTSGRRMDKVPEEFSSSPRGVEEQGTLMIYFKRARDISGINWKKGARTFDIMIYVTMEFIRNNNREKAKYNRSSNLYANLNLHVDLKVLKLNYWIKVARMARFLQLSINLIDLNLMAWRWEEGEGGLPHEKTGVFFILLSGTNCGFWSHLW